MDLRRAVLAVGRKLGQAVWMECHVKDHIASLRRQDLLDCWSREAFLAFIISRSDSAVSDNMRVEDLIDLKEETDDESEDNARTYSDERPLSSSPVPCVHDDYSPSSPPPQSPAASPLPVKAETPRSSPSRPSLSLGNQAAYSNDMHTYWIQLPNAAARASLIGLKGSRIQQMQTQSGLDLPLVITPDLQVQLVGSEHAIHRCLSLIKKLFPNHVYAISFFIHCSLCWTPSQRPC